MPDRRTLKPEDLLRRRLPVDKFGRLVLPAEWVRRLRLEPGEHLHARINARGVITLSDGSDLVPRRKVKRAKKG